MTAITAPPDLTAFVRREGRLPRLGDKPPPWRYRGWLLPYLIQLHGLVPAVADRWGYHLRTLEAGRLLDGPIPQVSFGPPDNKVFSLLHDWSRLIGRDLGGWGDFRALLDWLCWGLALCGEEPRLTDEVNEGLYRRVNLGPLLARPHDYLGEHVAAGKSRGWNPTGFYPTPHTVVECMVRMTMHDARTDGRDPRLASVCDPCVGSGRMLLHASNFSLCLYGQDIDPLAVAMCKVNGALYAPWLSFPLPESVLGTPVQAPPVALPGADLTPADPPAFRVNDRGQRLLFPM
jgi:N-6 DNA Methylase